MWSSFDKTVSLQTTALALSRAHSCLCSHCALAWAASVPVHEPWTMTVAVSLTAHRNLQQYLPSTHRKRALFAFLRPQRLLFRVKLSTKKGFTVCKGVGHQVSYNTRSRRSHQEILGSLCLRFLPTLDYLPVGQQKSDFKGIHILTSETCGGIILPDKQGFARVIKKGLWNSKNILYSYA